MSLKQARQIVAYARKRGVPALLVDCRAACERSQIGWTCMHGSYAVSLNGGGGPYAWSKADIDLAAG